MRLIKPSFEILEQQPGILGLYKQIELAGRTCYKSEDKITEDSAKGFVDRMIKSGHGAMLEHGTVYLEVPCYESNFTDDIVERYITNKYSIVRDKYEIITSIFQFDSTAYITTNLRVLVENGWTDDLKYICEPTEYHEKRVTVRFICDRGVSHEFVRHRVFSFAQESTRYCNYSKDKFGNELTFIQPLWLEDIDSNLDFKDCLQHSELAYFNLLDRGWKPQQARAVLPNSLKTELVMTGFVSDWKHFFKLRDAGSAHPQAQELAKPLHGEFIRRNYVNE
jgi:thymidylate synthase (FAD)